MGVSSVVLQLTERLMPVVRSELQSVLQVMATMPEWVAKRDLTEWEERCVAALEKVYGALQPAGQAANLRIIDPHLFLVEEIWELGVHNLYTNYQVEATKQEYQKLLGFFREQNIPGEKSLSEVDLSGW